MKEASEEFLDEHRNFQSIEKVGETVEASAFQWFVYHVVYLPVSIILWSLFFAYGYFYRMSESIYIDAIWSPSAITLETRIKYEFSVLTAKVIRGGFNFLRFLFAPIENYIDKSRSIKPTG